MLVNSDHIVQPKIEIGNTGYYVLGTRSSAIAKGQREALVSRNPATTKHLT